MSQAPISFSPHAPRLEGIEAGIGAVNLETAAQIESRTINKPDWAGCNGYRATLDSVIITDASLSGAILKDSGWMDVRLTGGEASGCTLVRSTLRRLDVRHIRATGFDLAEAELRDVQFVDCKINMANMRYAKLKKVIFEGCVLDDLDLTGAELDQVIIRGCQAARVDFSGAKCKAVDLRGTTLTSLKGLLGLRGATLSIAQLMELAPNMAAELGLIIAE